jgi:hypothetical protein
VTLPADVIDNLIAATLLQRGRVSGADLVGVDEAERGSALLSYYERHGGASALRLEGGDLVSGPPVTAPPTLLGGDSLSDVDRLLEGYEGADVAAEPSPANPSSTPLEPATSRNTADSGRAPRQIDARPGVPGVPGHQAETVETSSRSRARHAWLAWWLPVILIPLVGGIAAWFVLRRKHELAAKIMLGVGIGIGMLGSVLFLRYADDIAGFASGASRGTVITLPAGTASSRPANSPSPSSGGSATAK